MAESGRNPGGPSTASLNPIQLSKGKAVKQKQPFPKHRSCDGCRIRKIACSYRSDSLDRSIAPTPISPSSHPEHAQTRLPCRGCASKGIRCTIENEGMPLTRNRSGKNIRKAIANGNATASSTLQEPPTTVIVACQEPLNAVAITGQIGHLLMQTSSGPTEIEDAPPFCVPIFDKWSLCSRYEAAGTRIEQLCLSDQVLVSIMLAMGARKVSESAFGAWSRNAAYAQLAEKAVTLADQAALWRKADPSSINVMIMLWQLLSNGDLTAREGRQYLKAAIASLEELSRAASPMVDRSIGGYDCYLAVLLIDSSSALEACEQPLLLHSIVTRFTRTLGLPDVAWLDMLSRQPGLACLATITGDAVEHASLILRMVAVHVADLSMAPALGSPTSLWSQLDELTAWLNQTQHLRAINSDIALYIDMIWCIRLAAEAGLARALTQAAQSPYLDFQSQSIEADLSRCAWNRVSEGLSSLLKVTHLDKYGRNTLALMSGILWSHHRLTDFLLNTNLSSRSQIDREDPVFTLRQAEINVARAYNLSTPLTVDGPQVVSAASGDVKHCASIFNIESNRQDLGGGIAVGSLDDLFLVPLLADAHWSAV